MERNKVNIVCFGEVLWDIFPDGQRSAGGAPFNVAYHLSKMGVEVNMISRVGDDELGKTLLRQIEQWNIPTDSIQVSHTHPTSTVIAFLDEHLEARYDILQNVAWDFIDVISVDQNKINTADAFVFGSLAARSAQSRNTLFELLAQGTYNVFDINLRPPYYDMGVIKDLLRRTQLAKLNQAELAVLLEYLGKSHYVEKDGIKYLQDVFGIREIMISKGSKGALYAKGDYFYAYPALAIKVVDTVGSGDSFLAGFLSKRFEPNASVAEMMRQAISLAGFITAQQGACPAYFLDDFQAFCKTLGAPWIS